jgi:hypothetical protein
MLTTVGSNFLSAANARRFLDPLSSRNVIDCSFVSNSTDLGSDIPRARSCSNVFPHENPKCCCVHSLAWRGTTQAPTHYKTLTNYLSVFREKQYSSYETQLLEAPLFANGASGSLVVKTLGYKPEGRGFETRWGELKKIT